MSYTREPLSGSTHGRGIKIDTASTPGRTIHTGQASTTLTDVVTLYAYNSNATAVRRLTLEWGGTGAPDDNMVFDIEPKKTVCIVPDLIIRNSLVIGGFADVANEVVVFGFINREA